MGAHDEAKLDVKFIEFAQQMNLYLNHFPKHEKFGLSQQIRNAAYAVHGYIVESQKRYMKKTSLTNLDICHEQLRMFLRLAFELGYFKFKDGLYTFSRAVKAGNPQAIASCLGHAKRTTSLRHMRNLLAGAQRTALKETP